MPNPDIQIAADSPAPQLTLFKQFVEDSGQALGMASLTGCIMYVSPDRTYHTDDTPAADEKPAEVLPSSQSF